jgi:hypothetical protein
MGQPSFFFEKQKKDLIIHLYAYIYIKLASLYL